MHHLPISSVGCTKPSSIEGMPAPLLHRMPAKSDQFYIARQKDWLSQLTVRSSKVKMLLILGAQSVASHSLMQTQ